MKRSATYGERVRRLQLIGIGTCPAIRVIATIPFYKKDLGAIDRPEQLGRSGTDEDNLQLHPDKGVARQTSRRIRPPRTANPLPLN